MADMTIFSKDKMQLRLWMFYAFFSYVTSAFVACSSESGSDVVESPVISVVETSFELGKCTSEREGVMLYVLQEKVNYVCLNGMWSKNEVGLPEVPMESSSSLFEDENLVPISSSSLDNVAISSSSIDKNQTLYGSFIDSRDGKTYNYVTIKNQTWMAENLNYADSIKSPILEGNSWCYNKKEEYCNLFGRLYTRTAAIDSITSGCGYGVDCSLKIIQGICPVGWHIPTYDDFATLIRNIGFKVGNQLPCSPLKSTYGWHDGKNGSNAYGFNLLPAGKGDKGYYPGAETFDKITDRVHFWGSDSSAFYMYVFGCWTSDYPLRNYISRTIRKMGFLEAYSVRCIKDFVDYSPSTRDKEKVNTIISNKTFTDDRDGEEYHFVSIGSQKWMTENLRFDPGDGVYYLNGNPQTYPLSSGKDSSRVYTFAGAMDSATTLCGRGRVCKIGFSRKGNCPKGWRVPSAEDFKTMISFAGGEDIAGFFLRRNEGEEYGFDLYGFSAKDNSAFITSSEINADSLFVFVIDSDEARLKKKYKNGSKWPLRCVADGTP